MVIRLTHFSVTVFISVSLLLQSGCSRGPAKIDMPSIDADAAGKEALKMYDANKDGKISGAELDKVPSLRNSLEHFQSTFDKGITASDITDRIKKWQELKTGRVSPVGCLVSRNNQALVGAVVKFVPEKFMGNSIPVCSGKTDQNGIAQISVPLKDPKEQSGVPPGYYKVEITKPGENIPAKYNTQTIFGAEVCSDLRMTDNLFDIR